MGSLVTVKVPAVALLALRQASTARIAIHRQLDPRALPARVLLGLWSFHVYLFQELLRLY